MHCSDYLGSFDLIHYSFISLSRVIAIELQHGQGSCKISFLNILKTFRVPYLKSFEERNRSLCQITKAEKNNTVGSQMLSFLAGGSD